MWVFFFLFLRWSKICVLQGRYLLKMPKIAWLYFDAAHAVIWFGGGASELCSFLHVTCGCWWYLLFQKMASSTSVYVPLYAVHVQMCSHPCRTNWWNSFTQGRENVKGAMAQTFCWIHQLVLPSGSWPWHSSASNSLMVVAPTFWWNCKLVIFSVLALTLIKRWFLQGHGPDIP